ncbi:hypothetical protein CP336_08285 [Pseudomonas fluorescens]|nr:hypothetical protein CP336_08285 [Pseudomonas fluorescens]
MNSPKLLALFSLIGVLSGSAFAAQPQETVIAFTVNNVSSSAIEIKPGDGSKIEPYEFDILNFSKDLKISSLREGDSAGFGHAFLLTSGDKSCYFSSSITLTKLNGVISPIIQGEARTTGKTPAICSTGNIEQPKNQPYSYNVNISMGDLKK